LDEQIRDDDMGGEFSTHGEIRNAYKILVGKLEEGTTRMTYEQMDG
jgi:hypothetical protein